MKRRRSKRRVKRGHRLETAAMVGLGGVFAVATPLLMAYAAFWTFTTLSRNT